MKDGANWVLGIIIGLGIGIALDSFPTGVLIGLAIGAALGASRRGDKES